MCSLANPTTSVLTSVSQQYSGLAGGRIALRFGFALLLRLHTATRTDSLMLSVLQMLMLLVPSLPVFASQHLSFQTMKGRSDLMRIVWQRGGLPTIQTWIQEEPGEVVIVRSIILLLAAGVHRRHSHYFALPFSLAPLIDPLASSLLKAQILHECHLISDCCLQPGVAQNLCKQGLHRVLRELTCQEPQAQSNSTKYGCC